MQDLLKYIGVALGVAVLGAVACHWYADKRAEWQKELDDQAKNGVLTPQADSIKGLTAQPVVVAPQPMQSGPPRVKMTPQGKK